MTAVVPQLCVGALAIRDEHLLLIQRGTEPGRGLWSLPGGRVEPGETLAEAVVRETLEETGLDVLCDELVGWVERITGSHHFVIMDFAIAVLGRAEAVAGSDAMAVRWVPLWEVSEIQLVDGLLDFLADHDVITTL